MRISFLCYSGRSSLLWLLLSVSLSVPCILSAQQGGNLFNAPPAEDDVLRLIFYNVENLFDTLDDPCIVDEDFTPDGKREWHYGKYRDKLLRISRVLMHCGGWKKPALIGLCEVENRKVLQDLIRRTPLWYYHYEIIHFNTADRRGIDAALLYDPEQLRPLDARPLRLRFEGEPNKRSRDILYARFWLPGGQILHYFVNHWPSKYGGAQATETYRLQAGRYLRAVADAIRSGDASSILIACGDFNDGPASVSLSLLDEGEAPPFLNLMKRLPHLGAGTHKHAGQWEMLDQFLISPALLTDSTNTSLHYAGSGILSVPYLLTEELNQTGHRPYRSFAGSFYQYGFSDHLPVFLDLRWHKEPGRSFP